MMFFAIAGRGSALHCMTTSRSSLGALTLGAIGVVYGDIGTSVLYAVKEVFASGHVDFTHDNVYGVLSIFVWTLTVIVSLKYVTLVLRADNHGEGGLVAMLALAWEIYARFLDNPLMFPAFSEVCGAFYDAFVKGPLLGRMASSIECVTNSTVKRTSSHSSSNSSCILRRVSASSAA